jgi:hypothetical protein
VNDFGAGLEGDDQHCRPLHCHSPPPPAPLPNLGPICRNFEHSRIHGFHAAAQVVFTLIIYGTATASRFVKSDRSRLSSP